MAKVKPTEKQKKAFKHLVANGSTKKEAMVEAGYSERTARAPTKVTNSRGWEQLMEEYLPDDLLAEIHNDGLKATDFKGKKDYAVRHKYLDTAYKLKGRHAPDKLDVDTKQNVVLDDKTSELLDNIIKLRKENL